MQTQADLLALADQVLLKNNKPQPVVFARGKGCEVWDVAGQRYLDMTAGIAVCGLGHSHPEFTRRVQDQLGKLVHISNLYYNDQQILAAKSIVDKSFADRVFFCNSGAEANEGALKLARRYQSVVAGHPQRTKIVSTVGSFHGRTFATVAITGQEKYRQGFGPLVEPVEHIAYGDLDAATRALEGREACCIIVEPIQAEGGIVVPPPGYLAGLRRLCDDTGTILIFDEVQTGIGRTGKWFGHQHDDVTPDVMTLAKGLGGGVPIGAVACSEKAAAGLTMSPGGAVPHATTFGGNPLACSAAVAVLDIIEKEGLLERVTKIGEYLGGKLSELVKEFPGQVTGTRGRGLLRGIAVAGAPAQVTTRCREKGMLVSVAGSTVIRFAPPYIVENSHIDEAVSITRSVLAEGLGEGVVSPRGFLTLGDVPVEQWSALFDRAAYLKANRTQKTLAGKSVALVFEKASTRTRVSFEVGVFELGGHAVVLSSQGSQIARGEPIEDTARVLSGYCQGIVLRTFGQERVAQLARHASVPVVNGLSDQHHPCQVATDLFTVREKFGHIDGLRYAWIGDGNNMANSWIEAAGLFKLELALACPQGFGPDADLVRTARDRGAKLTLTTDPKEAATGAHVISTDVWASMGQEEEAAARRTAFAGYCVDTALMNRGAPDAIVLHCLPAHRGEEITGDVLDGPRSLAWVQAENRLHIGKAILEHVIADKVRA